MEYTNLLNSINEYVTSFFMNGSCKQFCYHNERHTNYVKQAASEMADYYQLTDEERFVVLAAANFHDLGYAEGGANLHEVRSAALARNFLTNEGVSDELIIKVENCILATRMPQHPKNLLEEIVCDADLFHLGTTEFDERNKLMLQEAEGAKGFRIDKKQWKDQTIELFQEHDYHTDYAQDKLRKGKELNLVSLMKNKKNKETGAEKGVNKKPERGVETMFRITSTNNQRLSDMADNKANLLLTVNSIILSLVVSVLLRSLDKNTHLIIPTIILMTVVVIVMVLAILATIPKIPNGYFTPDQVENKSVNLLFFGNFYKMPLDTYKQGMAKVMEDGEFLYGMLTKDVYSQGVVLGRKYRLLRYAYGTFMFGLIIAVVGFVISILCL